MTITGTRDNRVELIALTYDSDTTSDPVAEVHAAGGEVFVDTSPDGEVFSAEGPTTTDRTKQNPCPGSDGAFVLVVPGGFDVGDVHHIDAT